MKRKEVFFRVTIPEQSHHGWEKSAKASAEYFESIELQPDIPSLIGQVDQVVTDSGALEGLGQHVSNGREGLSVPDKMRLRPLADGRSDIRPAWSKPQFSSK